jgi:hypothetical protein
MIVDVPLSIAVSSLHASPRGPADPATLLREQLSLARSIGFRAAQLDGTAAGLRARELDRSARRELAALIRRAELGFSGIDLWIPSAHFAEQSSADRAVAATVGALELCADLTRLVGPPPARRPLDVQQDERAAHAPMPRHVAAGVPVPAMCVSLPERPIPGVIAALRAAADSFGTRLTNFGHALDRSAAGSGGDAPAGASDPILPGIDPITIIATGGDPAKLVAATPRLGAARVSPAAKLTGAAASPFDLVAYRVALAVIEFDGWVTADVREQRDPAVAASSLLRAWLSAP